MIKRAREVIGGELSFCVRVSFRMSFVVLVLIIRGREEV